MLAAVTGILRKRNLLGQEVKPEYNITLATAYFVNIDVFSESGNFFHVRLKERGFMPLEYENYERAWQAFPRHVPQPFGRYFKDEWEIVITRGVPHRTVPAGSIARKKHGLVREIIGFIEASSTGARLATPIDTHGAFLREVHERMTDPFCAAIVREWIGTGRLDGLPYISQHGDFVMNNLGLTGAGLVVFDWEDFGRITFPGLDLCTLLASETVFNADKLRVIIGGGNRCPDAYAEILAKSCPFIGMTPDLFRQMIPLLLVIFLELKRDYGEPIRLLMKKLIHDTVGGT